MFQFVFLCVSAISAATTTFLSVGDWGGAALGEPYSGQAMAVAREMERVASGGAGAKWVLNTGDNFQWCGIQSVEDVQVNTDQVDVFEKIGVPWWCSLGNHAQGQNVSAQIDLTGRVRYWNLPGRNYTKELEPGFVLVVLDTSPCVSGQRGDDRKLWDPCGEEQPTCSQDAGDDDYEGPCAFHENILSQDCGRQFAWFRGVWEDLREEDFVVVMGHHPVQEIDVESGFGELIGDTRVDLQLNGHTHLMNRQAVGGVGKQVTTGAGSMVGVTESDGGSSHEVLWTERVAGFTRHRVDWTEQVQHTEQIDTEGVTLQNFTAEF